MLDIISGPGLPLSAINALVIGKQSRAGAIGLLFYDHIINLDREIEFFWKRNKRHPVFLLYIFNRYFALGYYIFDTIPITFNGIVSSEACVLYLMLDVIVTTVATLTVQVILQLRIYALFNRSRKVLAILLTLCALEAAAMSVLIGLVISHLFHTSIPDTSVGCAYQSLPKISFLFFIPALVFEPILCGMVAYTALSTAVPVPLINRIARDSLIYFIGIFVELLVSAIIWVKAPGWMNIVNPWSAALPSLLGSRLMLNMREAVLGQNNSTSYIVEDFSSPVRIYGSQTDEEHPGSHRSSEDTDDCVA